MRRERIHQTPWMHLRRSVTCPKAFWGQPDLQLQSWWESSQMVRNTMGRGSSGLWWPLLAQERKSHRNHGALPLSPPWWHHPEEQKLGKLPSPSARRKVCGLGPQDLRTETHFDHCVGLFSPDLLEPLQYIMHKSKNRFFANLLRDSAEPPYVHVNPRFLWSLSKMELRETEEKTTSNLFWSQVAVQGAEHGIVSSLWLGE